MPGHARTKKTKEIADRRAKVAEMYLGGMRQVQIAEKIGVTQACISKDLSYLEDQWARDALRSMDKIKAKELAKIDQLERYYWDAWEKSQRPRESTERGQRGDVASAAVKTATRDGDPRFLAGVQWCIQKRCEIVGLNAMIRQLNLFRDVSNMSDDELKAQMAKYGLPT